MGICEKDFSFCGEKNEPYKGPASVGRQVVEGLRGGVECSAWGVRAWCGAGGGDNWVAGSDVSSGLWVVLKSSVPLVFGLAQKIWEYHNVYL